MLIAFEIEGDHLVVHKVTPGQDDYLQGLSEVLSEWISPEDEEAWRDLLNRSMWLSSPFLSGIAGPPGAGRP